MYVPLVSQARPLPPPAAVPAHLQLTHTCRWLGSALRLHLCLCAPRPHPSLPRPAPPAAPQAVLDGNDAGLEPRLRLRGYLVGNCVTDPAFDGNALVPFAYGKSLIRWGAALQLEPTARGSLHAAAG